MYPTSRSLNEALAQYRIDTLRREAQLYSHARQARASRRSAKGASTGR